MKRNSIITIVCFLCVLLICTVSARVTAWQKNLDEEYSVYASKEEQGRVFESLKADMGAEFVNASVIKESISPLYSYSVLDSDRKASYHSGDSIELKPWKGEDNSFCYIATVTKAFDNKRDGPCGYINILVKNGHAQRTGVIRCLNDDTYRELLEEGNGYEFTANYADVAEDMMRRAGRSSVVEPKYVRLVNVVGIGFCFYANDGADEFFYVLDTSFADVGGTAVGSRIIRAGEELERTAVAAEQQYERIFKESEGTGQQAGEDGGVASVEYGAVKDTVPFCFATGDTADVEKYFGIDLAGLSTHFPEAFKAPLVWPYFVAGGAAIVAAAAVAVILIAKKRRARASGEAPAEPAV